MERSRRTGLPGVKYIKKEVIDFSTSLKLEANEQGKESLAKKLGSDDLIYSFPDDIKKIASPGNYIAIIHADGNNLGKAFRDLNEKAANTGEKDKLGSTELNKLFSSSIENATLAASKKAVESTCQNKTNKSTEK